MPKDEEMGEERDTERKGEEEEEEKKERVTTDMIKTGKAKKKGGINHGYKNNIFLN